MLEAVNVRKRFGGLIAVDGVDVEIGENEVVGLIGPNGAGKTTLFNVIAGVYEPDGGTIRFQGADTQALMRPSRNETALLGLASAVIGGAIGYAVVWYAGIAMRLAVYAGIGMGFILGTAIYVLLVRWRRDRVTYTNPFRLTRAGLARTFQIVRVFEQMTVFENVLAGAMFGGEEPPSREEAERRAMEALALVGLDDQRDEAAGNLTVARQKQLELARALATDPDLLLLDEIASGLTPKEIELLSETIDRLRSEEGVSVFWIEHIMDAIMGVADRVIVLNSGKKIAEGPPAVIREDEGVIEAYLGEEA